MKADTICALCTPRGKGAISLIRISGPKALEITRGLAPFLPLKPVSHRAYFGLLKTQGKTLDQVLITYFAEGRSFTGEESLEISCHGGGVYNEILEALFNEGARPAERGEFSFQAFSNGKMDLIQTEALLQLIESQTKSARRQAFFQLEGRLSKKIEELEKKWLFVLSHLEADIDFALENLNTWNEEQLKEKLGELTRDTKDLLNRYQPFENLQKGLTFGIFGPSNAGKSSLFNALLKEEKAIVSEEEGTTRDVVEGALFNPSGLNIELRDSAGFRDSRSEGELKGQKKSETLFSLSDYKMALLDSTKLEKQNIPEILFQEPLKTLLVFTKKDLLKKTKDKKTLVSLLRKQKEDIELPPDKQTFFVSSLSGEGLSELKESLLSYGKIEQEDFVISNQRHYKALKVMEESLENCREILKKEEPEKDILALELRQGLLSIYEILGKQIDDQVLDNIFKEFCIGK